MLDPLLVNWVTYQFYSSDLVISKPLLDDWVNKSDFGHKPTRPIIVELERLSIITKAGVINGQPTWLMPQPVKEKISHLPIEFKNKPYEYFRDEELRETDFNKSIKWYDHQNAKQRFDDYPIVKSQRNWAIVISALLLIAELLTLALKN